MVGLLLMLRAPIATDSSLTRRRSCRRTQDFFNFRTHALTACKSARAELFFLVNSLLFIVAFFVCTTTSHRYFLEKRLFGKKARQTYFASTYKKECDYLHPSLEGDLREGAGSTLLVIAVQAHSETHLTLSVLKPKHRLFHMGGEEAIERGAERRGKRENARASKRDGAGGDSREMEGS